MTKVRKQKRKKRFRANVNRKRLRNKLQKLPKIECEDIESSWEAKRSIRTNLRDMGLAYDPNEALKISTSKRGIIKVDKLGKTVVEIEDEDDTGGDLNREKIHVANKLESDAKAPRERMFKLPKNQVQFVTYLMDKYGDDYKAMARDRKNYYQMTWCQIRAKINTFKSIPEQYAEYLLKSGEIVLDDPTPIEETRRKLGEENLKKFSFPQKRKIIKESKPVWDVESLDNEDENNESEIPIKNLTDSRNGKVKISKNGAKKLKLFSEDESSGDEKDDKKSSNSKMNKNQNSKLNRKVIKTKQKMIQKSQSSDSDSNNDETLEGDDEADGFVNLSDMSDEEFSEEDVLDDGEFVTDSNEDAD